MWNQIIVVVRQRADGSCGMCHTYSCDMVKFLPHADALVVGTDLLPRHVKM